MSEHLSNIFETDELQNDAIVRNFRTVQQEGKRLVNRELENYNLDGIISVGYRVNSAKATQFRIWATQTLKEFIIKGFVLDDNRLKQGQTLFGKDYLRNYSVGFVLFVQVNGEYTNKSPIFLLSVVLIMISILK